MGRFINIQNELINLYNIELCQGDLCANDWSRTHAHVGERRICKWVQSNSIQSTFTLLHEIGHIETTTYKMRRCEAEFYATVWAMNECKKYGLTVTDKLIYSYQNYIIREYDRGIRRHGKLPSLTTFRLEGIEDVVYRMKNKK